MMPNIEAKTILYIDDDELSALLVDRVLRIRGYKIVHKLTGLEGLEIAETTGPQIILINISLPDLNRRVITAHLRNNDKLSGVPLIALAPLRGEEAREMSAAFGCDGYITKPIDTERLPAQIERFLSRPPRSNDLSGEKAYLSAYNTQLVRKLENRVKELTAANQTLLTQNQQRADLFNALSKELQRPLHPIKDHIARLLNGAYGELKEKQRQALETISRQAEFLSYFAADLTYLSQFETYKVLVQPTTFDFNDLLNEVIAIIETLFEESAVRFEYNIDNHLPKMYADRNGIKQVVLHLLNNALNSGYQGLVTLTATTKDKRLQVNISHTSNTSSDSEATRRLSPTLLENEAEADANIELGLLISKHILEANSGKVWAASRQGQGTTYTFALPFD